MTTIQTIDAHTAGEPLRLIIGGFPSIEGRTMMEKRDWVRDHCDHLRRALMLEPRGHADMYGALLTEPEHAGSDAGLLFMHNEGYSTMCGHGVIAVATIALERRLIPLRSRLDPPQGLSRSGTVAPGDDVPALLLDTPAGTIHVSASMSGDRVASVSFRNVPSFVLAGGVPVRVGNRDLRADVAFGGAFYAIVDSEAAGIPILPDRLPELRRAGTAIKETVESTLRVIHPEDPALRGVYGTIFIGPSSSADADLRNVTIFADAQVDRSPCGTGTCAVMAVLAEMGVLGPGQEFTHESIIGTRFRGRVAGAATVGDLPAIVPEIEGSAYITGESTFAIDDRDPLRYGFRV
ncbi:MAG: proline racemase family protein [Acidobacteriota bacterium]